MFALMAVQSGRSHGIDVGLILDAVLREQGMTHKEAYLICGFTDGAAFSRALRAEPHCPLDLWKLAELPWRIQASFWSRYIAAQANRLTDDLRSDRLRMARIELVKDERKAL